MPNNHKDKTLRPNREKRQNRTLRTTLINGIVLLIIIGSLLMILVSLPIWQIKHLKITGLTNLTVPVVKLAARIPYGNNLLLLRPSTLTQRLEKLPLVERAIIHRGFPDTVHIEIVERRPFALVMADDGNSYVIDREGRVLGRSLPHIADIPAVSGIAAKYITQNILDGNMARSMAAIFKAFATHISPKKMAFDIKTPEDISLLVDDIVAVRFGNFAELDKKIRIVEALLSRSKIKWTQIEYIDVRFPYDPVIKARR